jgi:hypothetical protein
LPRGHRFFLREEVGVLAGQIFGPLADPRVFEQVRLDEESGTLVWPNGADFDPATLHDWPEEGPPLPQG